MLQAKQREMFGAWSNEDDARFLKFRGEGRIFR